MCGMLLGATFLLGKESSFGGRGGIGMESNMDHTLISVCFPIISAYCQVELTHNYSFTLNEGINQKKQSSAVLRGRLIVLGVQ